MSQRKTPVRLRDANSEDVGFVFNSWLRSYRNAQMVRGVSNTIYYNEHHKILERIVKTARVIIACDPEDSTKIYGYACAEFIDSIFVIHYVYVKELYRKLGIARLMLDEWKPDFNNASICTHINKCAEAPAIRRHILYHPYILVNGLKFEVDKKVEHEPKPTAVKE